MIRDVPEKHPDSDKWYWLKWDPKELQGADITNAVWTPPTGILVIESSISTVYTGVKLGGGTLGTEYLLELEIQTSTGELLHEELVIRVSREGH